MLQRDPHLGELVGQVELRSGMRSLALIIALAIILCGPARAEGPSDDAAALRAHVSKLTGARKFAEAVAVQRKLVMKVEKDEIVRLGRTGEQTAQELGILAYRALFAGRPTEALRASQRAQKLSPDQLWIETNRAHALLFLDRKAEALGLYLAHRDKKISHEDLWQDSIEADFDAFAAAGITHPSMSKILRALGVARFETSIEREASFQRLKTLDQEGQYGLAIQHATELESSFRHRYGDGHRRYADVLTWQSRFHERRGRFDLAEPLLNQALVTAERFYGSDDLAIVPYLSALAEQHKSQSRYADAVRPYERALAIVEAKREPNHEDVTLYRVSLSHVYRQVNRPDDAIQLHEKALAAAEKALGTNDLGLREPLLELAGAYAQQKRHADAVNVYERLERLLDPKHSDLVRVNLDLAEQLVKLRRVREAEERYKSALATAEQEFGADSWQTIWHLNHLGRFYGAQRLYAQGDPLIKQILHILDNVLGDDDNLDNILSHVHAYYHRAKRYADAIAVGERMLRLREKRGETTFQLQDQVWGVAADYFEIGDWAKSAAYWRRSADDFIARYRRAPASLELERAYKEQPASRTEYFTNVIATEYRLATEQRRSLDDLARDTFEIAQWAQSISLGDTLAQMTARSAKGNVMLSALVRERQDLMAKFERRALEQSEVQDRLLAIDSQLRTDYPDYWSLSRPDTLSVSEVQAYLREDEALLLTVSNSNQIGGVAEETYIWAVTKSDVRMIRSDVGEETLRNHVQTLRCGLEGWLWDDREWSAHCQSLLGATPSRDDTGNIWWETLPFSLVHAHAIYDALLRPLETYIGDKSLLIVPSGILAHLPFQILVTALPPDVGSTIEEREVTRAGLLLANFKEDDRDYFEHGVDIAQVIADGPAASVGVKVGDILLSIDDRTLRTAKEGASVIQSHAPGAEVVLRLRRGGDEIALKTMLGVGTVKKWKTRLLNVETDRDVHWLIRKHAMTVLPGVSALKALRQTSKASNAHKPMLGIGNPLLDGNRVVNPKESEWADLAQRKQECAQMSVGRSVTRSIRRPRSDKQAAVGKRLIDLAQLRSQSPLPDTADELCSAAKVLESAADDILLGARATEANINHLNVSGRLSEYRVVHFATHGVLRGQIDGANEPGLILTPPQTPTESDDGFLSASEVMGLSLDADWVILSACSTAGGGRGEHHVQLPNAFFYAGARSLLVSHWAVASEATVKLVTRAVGTVSRDRTIGRAEGLRRSMLSMIDELEPYDSHPAYWAPFVLMGEGAAVMQ